MQTNPLWRFYPTIRIGKQAHTISASPVHICETSELLRVTFEDCNELTAVWIARELDIDINNHRFIAFWKLINGMITIFPDFETINDVKLISYLLNYFNVTNATIIATINEKIVNFAGFKESAEEFRTAAIDFVVPKLEKYLALKRSEKFNLIDPDIDEYVDNLTILAECTDESFVKVYLLRLLKPAAGEDIATFAGLLHYLKEYMTDERRITMEPFENVLNRMEDYAADPILFARLAEDIETFGQM